MLVRNVLVILNVLFVFWICSNLFRTEQNLVSRKLCNQRPFATFAHLRSKTSLFLEQISIIEYIGDHLDSSSKYDVKNLGSIIVVENYFRTIMALHVLDFLGP